MNVIKVLPENLANQIKAGEVVERPANVVKEILENAIDAGAKSISLSVKNGGRTMIKVVDDGFGMSSKDAETCLSRHATSKIYSQKDLFSIDTLGFRGEALASIGSVSVLTLKTKKRQAEVGDKVVMESGKIILHEPCQTSSGTSIEISNLFYNIPARFKFLRTNTTENKHILQEFFRVALPNPQVAFSYINNDTLIHKFPKESIENRLIKVWGEPSLEKFLPIREETSMMQISGYVSKVEYGQRGSAQQYVFVNRRFVRSPMINKAVRQSFERLMEQDKSPSFIVFIEINPEKININIHPKKTEIKFEDEGSVFKIIQTVVRKTIGQFQIEKNPELTLEGDIIEAYKKPQFSHRARAQHLHQNTFRQTDLIKSSQQEHIDSKNLPTPMDIWESELMEQVQDYISSDNAAINLDINKDNTLYQKEKNLWDQGLTQKIAPKYAIHITSESFFIVHIQRMYEVLFYENLLLEKGKGELYSSESLLLPIELDFSGQQLEKIDQIDSYLKKIGLSFQVRKSKGIVVIKAIPSFFRKANLKEFIEHSILDREASEKEEGKVWSEYVKALSIRLAKVKVLHSSSNLREDMIRFFPYREKYRYSLSKKLIYTRKKLSEIDSIFNENFQHRKPAE